MPVSVWRVKFAAPTGLLSNWKSEEEMEESCAVVRRACLHGADWVDKEPVQQARELMRDAPHQHRGAAGIVSLRHRDICYRGGTGILW